VSAILAAEPLTRWLRRVTGDDGPFLLHELAGGNSNETMLVTSEASTVWRVLRRAPDRPIAPGANDMAREHRVLCALSRAGAPVPAVLAPLPGIEDRTLGSVLLMEWIDGVSITDQLPGGYDRDNSLRAIGQELVDALARLHSVDWVAAGLEDFGRPAGYLGRQVQRGQMRFEQHTVRDLALADELGLWLERHLPVQTSPGLVHGDFHLDNSLFRRREPQLAAVIDFELSTIGDPLVDVGLLLAFWGSDRPVRAAMPHLQGVTRHPSAPSRSELADSYEALTGRSVNELRWYMTFALWRLASIIEGAYVQSVQQHAGSDYARSLESEVPRLLEEAQFTTQS